MPRDADPPFLHGNYGPVPDETTLAGLSVEGSLPVALSGQYVRIGPNPLTTTVPPRPWRSLDGMVHGVALHAGRAVGYRNRWVITDAVARTLGAAPVPGPPATSVDTVAGNVITFGNRILALGPGALAYELDQDLDTIGRIDLAGHGLGIGAHPQLDPLTGDLHLVSYADEPAHHAVSASGQTRTTRPIDGAPGPIDELLLTRERVVLLGDGFVGMARRTGPAGIRWTAASPSEPINAQDHGDEVAVLAGGASLDRWTFGTADRARLDVLDNTPQRFGCVNPALVGDAPRYVWTVAPSDGTDIYRHDLHTGERTSHHLGSGRHPGAFTFIADPARRHREDGGWLLGLVHDMGRIEAELLVLDAAAIDRAAIAAVRIPRRIPYGLHGTWVPAAI
jgi:carotenoid cleavage dioxygenase-like enzyme